MRTNRRVAAALPAVLAIVAAGCGGGGEDVGAVATSPAEPAITEHPDATETTETTEAPAATKAPDETETPDETEAPDEAEAAGTTDASVQAMPAGITRIEVESTVDQYFVLFVTPDPAQTGEIAVAAALGQDGVTVLTDGRMQLPEDRYRVETLSVADPADTDGDGIDDVTELADPTLNPLNPAPAIDIHEGTAVIRDRDTFETLSYQGEEVLFDGHLAGMEFLKFFIIDVDSAFPQVYFANTENYRGHPLFAQAVDLPGGRGVGRGQLRGQLVYMPDVQAADGSMGVYRFEFQPNDSYSFADIQRAYEVLAASMPFLTGNLVYYPMPPVALPRYEDERALYDASRVQVLLDSGLVAPRTTG